MRRYKDCRLFASEEMDRQLDYLFVDEAGQVSLANLLAISRTRSLAIVVASPRLLEISHRTVEQVQLVNTLCWAASVGHGFR